MQRTAIPSATRRAVLLEAGHRCAIPTCKQTPVEVAHVVPWAETEDHAFENLIALCPTCHRRYDAGEIDRRSMQQYKANLGLINSRYGDLERRVLDMFAQDPDLSVVVLSGALLPLMWYLVADGIVDETQVFVGALETHNGLFEYRLTDKGHSLVEDLRTAGPVV